MPTPPRIALVTAAIALPLGAALVTWALPGEPAPTAPVEVRLRDNAVPDPSTTGTSATGTSVPTTTTTPAPPADPTTTAPPAPPAPVVVAPPPPVPPGDDDDDGGGDSDGGDD